MTVEAEREGAETVALVVTRRQEQLTAALDWSEEQKLIIRDQYCRGATDSEFAALMAIAKAKRLDPLRKQIYFRKQKQYNQETDSYTDQWITITAIDGFRVIADRTGLYDGQDEPEFEYDKEDYLLLARVRVYRKDIKRAFVGVARLDEFQQTKRDGKPNQMWAKMPHSQLAKCAEALGFRKAFPDDCGGLYAPEEFAQEQHDAVSTAERMSIPAPASTGGTLIQPPDSRPPVTAGVSGPAQQTLTPAPTGPQGQAKVDAWVARFEASKSEADIEALGQQAALEAFTGPERKAVVKAWTAWRTCHQAAAKKALDEKQAKTEPEREPGAEG
jgi:phage recombination protein Bet